MLKTRVIPSLLLRNGGLVKTVRFSKSTYIGDPINAIKIFNDKEVDELAIIDIGASRSNQPLRYDIIDRISKEAFMPLAYGGGIRDLNDVQRILSLGYEKVIINSIALTDPNFITQAANICGSQSIVICIDCKRYLWHRYQVYDHMRRKKLPIQVGDYAARIQDLGAGEILAYSVDQDGTYQGYDTNALKEISSRVTIPVIALGGAGSVQDFSKAIVQGGASAVAAGSMFVFHGPHRAVLITYPERTELEKALP